MKNHKLYRDENGAGHFLLILFVFVILTAVVFTGWRVYEDIEDGGGDGRPAARLEETAEPCEGKYYDSHAHPDDDAVLEKLPGLMTEHSIGCSVLFTQMDINDIDTSLLEAREEYSGMPGRIAVFYDVVKDSPSEVTKEKLDDLWQKSGGEFIGLGEFAFYEKSFVGTQLSDPGWDVIFEFAGEKDLVIMIHPQPDMVESLKSMLKRYPDTEVIVHGFELPDQMGGLLNSHKNLYFTLDAATFFVLGELTSETIPEHLFYPGGGPNTSFDVSEFVSKYDSKKSAILKQAEEKWLSVFLAAPEKVMWGTDISMEGHVDKEVYARVMDFADAFAQKIPENNRNGYLRDNAFNLLGEGNRLKPLSDSEIRQLDNDEQDDGHDN